ncbi:DMP19 family protein [Rhizobium herbae]|uniref:DNA mimic protein DMP19 C-terminal domain-containing protein n=1 Tax=Rhizobium herbae TaxID=508661 RepID=A0ABS4EGR0_9HYPH|nr:DUF4375 domain-containing protein [Rhizobium herbae]MBP1857128.1 hypothetical protein [Rhizobium herbae]
MPIYLLGLRLNTPTEEEAVKARASLADILAAFAPTERPILMLTAVDRWTDGPEGMRNFFFLDKGVFLGEVIKTLETAGLEAHAALFREGRALLDWDHSAPGENHSPLSNGNGDIVDPVVGARLDDLSRRYNALPSLIEVAAQRLSDSTELSSMYESLRSEASDDLKLEFLASGLMNCLASPERPTNLLHSLAELPPAYTRLIAIYLFVAELENGSMHQFFYNDSGALAPDIVEVLKSMGLVVQANAVQSGIDGFPVPYPRDLKTRREFMGLQNSEFDETLSGLSDMIDYGALRDAWLKDARQTGILPL